MKTSELTDLALDWAVAECNGDEPYLYRINTYEPPIYVIKCRNNILTPAYHYDWSQGGPIIEREVARGMCPFGTGTDYGANYYDINLVGEFDDGLRYLQLGPTLLVAAMRCYVASKLGDAVDIPEELG